MKVAPRLAVFVAFMPACVVDFESTGDRADPLDAGRSRDAGDAGDGGGEAGDADPPIPSWRIAATGTIDVSAPRAGDRLGMAYDAARMEVILFGGATARRNATWSWKNRAWTDKQALTTMAPRSDHAMAYHARDQRVVVFGGEFDDSLNRTTDETWLWDGAEWTQDTRALHPSERSYSMMVYDPLREVLVLFGGERPDLTNSDETWEWDLEHGWSPSTATGASPPARKHFGLAFDSIEGRVVLFGGQSGVDHLFNDRWTYGGSPPAWDLKPASSFGPSPCSHISMAFDEHRGALVVFGGTIDMAGHRIDELWELRDEAWSRLFLVPHPSERVNGALIYDPRVERLLLFGGHPNDPDDDMTTWEYGVD